MSAIADELAIVVHGFVLFDYQREFVVLSTVRVQGRFRGEIGAKDLRPLPGCV